MVESLYSFDNIQTFNNFYQEKFDENTPLHSTSVTELQRLMIVKVCKALTVCCALPSLPRPKNAAIFSCRSKLFKLAMT